MEVTFLCAEELVKFFLEKKGENFLYSDNQGSLELNIREISPGVLSILIDEKSFLAAVARDKNKIIVAVEGCRFEFEEASAAIVAGRGREEATAAGLMAVKAPMPGKVVRVVVAEGEKVRKNQTLAIVEAMKMENEIKAAVEGIIKKIHVAEGELVDSEKPLLELEASP